MAAVVAQISVGSVLSPIGNIRHAFPWVTVTANGFNAAALQARTFVVAAVK